MHSTDTCRLQFNKEKHKPQMCVILLASIQTSCFFTVLSGIDWMLVCFHNQVLGAGGGGVCGVLKLGYFNANRNTGFRFKIRYSD